MSYKKIIQYPDPRLSYKSKEVRFDDPLVQDVVRDLKLLAKKHSKDGIMLVGLSAPQLGVNWRVFVYYDFKAKKYYEVINPKLIYSSKELTYEWEGCASVGSGAKSLFAPIARSKNCKISYVNSAGREQILEASDYLSHVILHELDHLEGILFLDRVEDPQMILTAEEIDRYAKKHGGRYPPIRK